MTQTNNLKIDLVAQSQSQKEITINQAFARLDAVQNRGVLDKDLATPPGSPVEGNSYIVAGTATGAWLGKEKQIAFYNNGWQFIAPNQGSIIWVDDEAKLYYFDGSNWQSYSDNFQNLSKLGINTSADATNRLAVAADAVLLNAASSNFQLKLNKPAASNTASILLQDGYSGRAEIGLIGDDNFTFKVSADGSTFNSAIVLDKATGNAGLNSGFTVGSGTQVKKILSATATLDFPSIAANSSADLTVTVTGATAASSASVALGLANAPTAGIIFMGWVSAVNTVTIRAFNVTGGAIDPASQTFRVTVLNF